LMKPQCAGPRRIPESARGKARPQFREPTLPCQRFEPRGGRPSLFCGTPSTWTGQVQAPRGSRKDVDEKLLTHPDWRLHTEAEQTGRRRKVLATSDARRAAARFFVRFLSRPFDPRPLCHQKWGAEYIYLEGGVPGTFIRQLIDIARFALKSRLVAL
jgi:hypothetical protein